MKKPKLEKIRKEGFEPGRITYRRPSRPHLTHKQKGEDVKWMEDWAKISGPQPTKLCACGLYLIEDTETRCDVCRTFGGYE